MLSRTKLLSAVLAAALLAGCGVHPLVSASSRALGALGARDAAVVHLDAKLKLLASAPVNIDAPRLSPDKRMVTYVVRAEKQVPDIIKRAAGLDPKESAEEMLAWCTWLDGSHAPDVIAGHILHNVVEPSFTPDGRQIIYCVQKHYPFITRGVKLEEMRLEQVDLASRKTQVIYDGPLTLLHPMYSPDGRTIAAYSRNVTGQEGLYLLDATRPHAVPVRVSAGDDKHPVWSADGQTLFFHNQVGGDANSGAGDGDEHAWIGKLDLSDRAHPKRTMLDDVSQPLFHKHPTPMPGTDIVVYHSSAGDDTWLEALSLTTGKHVRLGLSGLSPQGLTLAKFKHAQFSADGRQLVMVGRSSKKDAATFKVNETYKVYMLSDTSGIQQALAP
jgi:Tol biopolymer transport system component